MAKTDKLICINSAPSITNEAQLVEGRTYYPYFFMPGFAPGKILVALKDVGGFWDYDRFIPANLDHEIESQIFDALK